MDLAHKTIREEALANHTEEVCGFVVRNGKEISAVKANNDAEDKVHLFQINPIQFLSTFQNNDEVLYVYHSHLTGSAEPSDFDLVMSKHADIDFLIYSIRDDNFKIHSLT